MKEEEAGEADDLNTLWSHKVKRGNKWRDDVVCAGHASKSSKVTQSIESRPK